MDYAIKALRELIEQKEEWIVSDKNNIESYEGHIQKSKEAMKETQGEIKSLEDAIVRLELRV